MRRAYQTDLSDAERDRLEPHLPTPKAPGRPRVHSLREILITPSSSTSSKADVPGACCPTTSLPFKTIHHYFRTWRIDGTWERMHAALRERVRVRMGRDP